MENPTAPTPQDHVGRPIQPSSDELFPKSWALVLGVLMLLVIGALGYLAYQNYQLRQEVAQQALQPVPEPEILDPVILTYTDPQGRYQFQYSSDWHILPAVPTDYLASEVSSEETTESAVEGNKMFLGECRGPILQNTMDPDELIAFEVVEADGDGLFCWSTGEFAENNQWTAQDEWLGDFAVFQTVSESDEWNAYALLVNRETYTLMGQADFEDITQSFQFTPPATPTP